MVWFLLQEDIANKKRKQTFHNTLMYIMYIKKILQVEFYLNTMHVYTQFRFSEMVPK